MAARSRAFQELVDELSGAMGSEALLTGPEAAAIAAGLMHRRVRTLRLERDLEQRRSDALADAVEGFLFGDLEQVELVMAWLGQRAVVTEDDDEGFSL